MMQQLRNPKNVKMISLFVAAIFVLSCFAITLQQGSFSGIASAASSESAIGVVNYQMLLSQSPDLASVEEAMKQMEPVFQKIEAAIKKVADKKGLAVVVEKNTVIYGGLDITDEVAKTLQSGK